MICFSCTSLADHCNKEKTEKKGIGVVVEV